MKKPIYRVIPVIVFILLVNACKKDISTLPVIGALVNNSDCKANKSASFTCQVTKNQSCAEYTYDHSQKKLAIKHINTAFNCCPGKLSCNVSIKGDTLIIKESEKQSLCDCICLYDMEIEIKNLTAGKYRIRFIEPYGGTEENLTFEVDLTRLPEGSFCVNRNKYPWGI